MELNLEEHYDKIYRYCYFKIRNQSLAEDITQETFLRYLECHNYEDTGRPLAFLYTIARNLCMDQFRKKRMEELPEDIPIWEDEDQKIASFDLKVAIRELNPHERELVILRFVNEVPIGTMSKIYGISRFALYRELKQILKKIEGRVSDGSEDKGRAQSFV